MLASPQELAAGDALVRVRRERIHTAMLIELLVLLVFLAMAFAFVRDNEKRVDTIQDKLKETEKKLDEANMEIAELSQEVETLKRANRELQIQLARFMDAPKGTLPATAKLILLPEKDFKENVGRRAEAEKIIADLQVENAMLRKKLATSGKGGTDLPRCAVAAGSYIARIEALGSGGFIVRPMWSVDAAPTVAQVPGLVELASSKPLSQSEFRQLASKVQSWGKQQQTPCGFSVIVQSQHSQMSLYKRQFQIVGAHFYSAWR